MVLGTATSEQATDEDEENRDITQTAETVVLDCEEHALVRIKPEPANGEDVADTSSQFRDVHRSKETSEVHRSPASLTSEVHMSSGSLISEVHRSLGSLTSEVHRSSGSLTSEVHRSSASNDTEILSSERVLSVSVSQSSSMSPVTDGVVIPDTDLPASELTKYSLPSDSKDLQTHVSEVSSLPSNADDRPISGSETCLLSSSFTDLSELCSVPAGANDVSFAGSKICSLLSDTKDLSNHGSEMDLLQSDAEGLSSYASEANLVQSETNDLSTIGTEPRPVPSDANDLFIPGSEACLSPPDTKDLPSSGSKACPLPSDAIDISPPGSKINTLLSAAQDLTTSGTEPCLLPSDINDVSDSATKTSSITCVVCGKQLYSYSYLKGHMRTHTGEKPYSCSVCGREFSLSQNLKKHNRIHTGEKRYRCSHCDKLFTDSQSMKRHTRIHTGEMPYQCSVCTSMKFRYREMYIQHMKDHSCHVSQGHKGRPRNSSQRIDMKTAVNIYCKEKNTVESDLHGLENTEEMVQSFLNVVGEGVVATDLHPAEKEEMTKPCPNVLVEKRDVNTDQNVAVFSLRENMSEICEDDKNCPGLMKHAKVGVKRKRKTVCDNSKKKVQVVNRWNNRVKGKKYTKNDMYPKHAFRYQYPNIGSQSNVSVNDKEYSNVSNKEYSNVSNKEYSNSDSSEHTLVGSKTYPNSGGNKYSEDGSRNENPDSGSKTHTNVSQEYTNGVGNMYLKDGMGHTAIGNMGQTAISSMGQTNIGSMGQTNIGSMPQTAIGSIGQNNFSSMGQPKVGSMPQTATGSMAHMDAGSKEYAMSYLNMLNFMRQVKFQYWAAWQQQIVQNDQSAAAVPEAVNLCVSKPHTTSMRREADTIINTGRVASAISKQNESIQNTNSVFEAQFAYSGLKENGDKNRKSVKTLKRKAASSIDCHSDVVKEQNVCVDSGQNSEVLDLTVSYQSQPTKDPRVPAVAARPVCSDRILVYDRLSMSTYYSPVDEASPVSNRSNSDSAHHMAVLYQQSHADLQGIENSAPVTGEDVDESSAGKGVDGNQARLMKESINDESISVAKRHTEEIRKEFMALDFAISRVKHEEQREPIGLILEKAEYQKDVSDLTLLPALKIKEEPRMSLDLTDSPASFRLENMPDTSEVYIDRAEDALDAEVTSVFSCKHSPAEKETSVYVPLRLNTKDEGSDGLLTVQNGMELNVPHSDPGKSTLDSILQNIKATVDYLSSHSSEAQGKPDVLTKQTNVTSTCRTDLSNRGGPSAFDLQCPTNKGSIDTRVPGSAFSQDGYSPSSVTKNVLSHGTYFENDLHSQDYQAFYNHQYSRDSHSHSVHQNIKDSSSYNDHFQKDLCSNSSHLPVDLCAKSSHSHLPVDLHTSSSDLPVDLRARNGHLSKDLTPTSNHPPNNLQVGNIHLPIDLHASNILLPKYSHANNIQFQNYSSSNNFHLPKDLYANSIQFQEHSKSKMVNLPKDPRASNNLFQDNNIQFQKHSKSNNYLPKDPHTGNTQIEEGSKLYKCRQRKRAASDATVGLVTCSVCGNQVKKSYLSTHLRNHRGYSCEFCGLMFRGRLYRNKHRRLHTGEQPFQCSVCGDRFLSQYKLSHHQQLAHAMVNSVSSVVSEGSRAADGSGVLSEGSEKNKQNDTVSEGIGKAKESSVSEVLCKAKEGNMLSDFSYRSKECGISNVLEKTTEMSKMSQGLEKSKESSIMSNISDKTKTRMISESSYKSRERSAQELQTSLSSADKNSCSHLMESDTDVDEAVSCETMQHSSAEVNPLKSSNFEDPSKASEYSSPDTVLSSGTNPQKSIDMGIRKKSRIKTIPLKSFSDSPDLQMPSNEIATGLNIQTKKFNSDAFPHLCSPDTAVESSYEDRPGFGYLVPDCDVGESASIKKSLSDHQNCRDKPKLYCIICEKDFDSEEQFDKHLADHNGLIQKPENNICRECGEEFDCSSEFEKHVNMHDQEGLS